MDSTYLNKLIERCNWLEGILPFVEGDGRGEVEKEIGDLKKKIHLQNQTLKAWVHFILDMIETDDRLRERFYRIMEMQKEIRDASNGKL